jgi:hypothetical protein
VFFGRLYISNHLDWMHGWVTTSLSHLPFLYGRGGVCVCMCGKRDTSGV